MKAKMKGYQYGGGFTMGAGDGDMSPAKAGMIAMAKGGGLMGFMSGGSVLDPMMKKMQPGGEAKDFKVPTVPFKPSAPSAPTAPSKRRRNDTVVSQRRMR